MTTEKNPFEKLLNIPKNPEVEQNIAEGFEEREKKRQSYYAQQENSQQNFDLYREYVIWKSKKKRKKPVLKTGFLFYEIL